MATFSTAEAFGANLVKLTRRQVERAGEVIREAGEQILEESERLVPLDTGTLARSGRVDYRANWLQAVAESTIEYGAEYAAFVHERTDMALGPQSRAKDKVITSRFGGVGPRFLARPLEGLEPEIMREIAQAVAGG